MNNPHIGDPFNGMPHNPRSEDQYSRVLEVGYKHHAQLVARDILDPSDSTPLGEVTDTSRFGYWQKRLTKTDRGKHLASVVFAVHQAHNNYDWSISDEARNRIQTGIAGTDQDLRDAKTLAKSFAQKLNSQRLSYDSSPLGNRYNENDVIHKHIAVRNESRTLAELVRTTVLLESSDYNKWLDDMTSHAAKGLNKIRDEKNNTGTTSSGFDLRYKHPDTPGFGYQGGKKAAQSKGAEPAGDEKIHLRSIFYSPYDTSTTRFPKTMHEFSSWSADTDDDGQVRKIFKGWVDDHMHVLSIHNHADHGVYQGMALIGPSHIDLPSHLRKLNTYRSDYIAKVRSAGNMVPDEHGFYTVDLYHFDTHRHAGLHSTKDTNDKYWRDIGSHPEADNMKWSGP